MALNCLNEMMEESKKEKEKDLLIAHLSNTVLLQNFVSIIKTIL
jgi:hypothetical protein